MHQSKIISGTVVASVVIDLSQGTEIKFALSDNANNTYGINSEGDIYLIKNLNPRISYDDTIGIIAKDSEGNSYSHSLTIQFGTASAESLNGDNHQTIIFGQGGADEQGAKILGGIDDDKIVGGTHGDILQGQNSDDHIVAGSGADIVKGGSGEDKLFGGDEDDKLYRGRDADELYGYNGNGILKGGAGKVKLYGEDGNDKLLGQKGSDELLGGLGNDILNGSKGEDHLYGWNGNDRLNGGSENDFLFGEARNDVLNGGGGNDHLFAGTGADRMYGGDGADKVFGFDGNDILAGNAGNDQLYGEDGNDLFLSIGGDGSVLVEGGYGEAWIDTLKIDSGASSCKYRNGTRCNPFASIQLGRLEKGFPRDNWTRRWQFNRVPQFRKNQLVKRHTINTPVDSTI